MDNIRNIRNIKRDRVMEIVRLNGGLDGDSEKGRKGKNRLK